MTPGFGPRLVQTQSMTHRLDQRMVLSPQMLLSIRLLQLSRTDLEETVRDALVENPMLEEPSEMAATEPDGPRGSVPGDPPPETAQPAPDAEFDWASYLERDARPAPGPQRLRHDDLPGIEATYSRHATLGEHLLWQLGVSGLSPQEKRAAAMLIGHAEDDGYLRADLDAIADALGNDRDYVEDVLELTQRFDPPGVMARDLRECLAIQVRRGELGELAARIVEAHFDDLMQRDLRAIGRRLGRPIAEVQAAARAISRLEPRPGRPFVDARPRHITPDVFIRHEEGAWRVALNDDGLPRLRISAFYRRALQASADADVRRYATERLGAARWLIESIEQRKRTIVKVTESIALRQHAFLERGVTHLRPMVMREVADDIGMHESTVCRVVADKWVHTPQGLFELRWFFNPAIERRGGDLASEAVKCRVRALIAGEDPHAPLSDQRICALLADEGIRIARRTVAKYREVMAILPRSMRRRVF